MEAKAITKMLRVSPLRARLVIDLIRGKDVSDALNTLNNLKNKSSPLIKKTLESAIANAVNNNGMDVNNLYVKEARVDGGPIMKRQKPNSRGYIARNDRRTSHIVIVVADKN